MMTIVPSLSENKLCELCLRTQLDRSLRHETYVNKATEILGVLDGMEGGLHSGHMFPSLPSLSFTYVFMQ
jgi:hypothetical protein